MDTVITDTDSAAQLAERLKQRHEFLSERVSARLLAAFPELAQLLQLESLTATTPARRLGQASVDRFTEMVRAMLIFEDFSIASREIQWAIGVLPHRGVRFEHQSTMVRWFFDEVSQMDLPEAERQLSYQLRDYLLGLVRTAYAV